MSRRIGRLDPVEEADVSASLDRVAELLEAAARELRDFAGSSRGDLDPLVGGEAQCDVPGQEPVAPPPMTPPISTETSPVPTTDLPLLMTRAEVAQLLRIHERTVRRLRLDPEMQFPEPIQLGTSLRWKRSSIMRWIASKAQ